VSAWLAGALLAAATVGHYVAVRGVVPSLVLIVVVWYSIRVDARRAALCGLAAGLGEDAISAQTGVAWTVSTCLSAMLASRLSRGFFADSIPLAASVMAVTTLLRALVFWVVMGAQGYPRGLGLIHAHEAMLAAVLNACVIVVAMLVARRFELSAA